MEDRASPEGNCVGHDFFEIMTMYVRVAQLDRALGYGPRCRGFESSHARLERRCKSISFFYISFFSSILASYFSSILLILSIVLNFLFPV